MGEAVRERFLGQTPFLALVLVTEGDKPFKRTTVIFSWGRGGWPGLLSERSGWRGEEGDKRHELPRTPAL